MTTPLRILYEDQHLICIDKPAGYLVHPADQPQEGDLVAMKILRDQIGKKVYPIHRLDRPTSGVLLFGLTKNAATMLTESLKRKEWQKTYLAVTHGSPPEEQWESRLSLQKKDGAPYQDAHTSFTLLKSKRHPALHPWSKADPHADLLHLIQAIPHSGRFHQIRRHLSHNGTPIVGDYRYAGISTSDALCTALDIGTRMLLCAHSLSVPHPASNELVRITAPSFFSQQFFNAHIKA